MRYLISCQACGHVETRRDYDGQFPFDSFICGGCSREFMGDLPGGDEARQVWPDEDEAATAVVMQFPFEHRLAAPIRLERTSNYRVDRRCGSGAFVTAAHKLLTEK